MKVLILGSGAREHALAWAIERSKRNAGLFCLPGNAGTEDLALNLPGDPADPATVIKAWKSSGADLVVVGPEAPLAAGVADALRAEGAKVFGPGASAAMLESSKSFGRALADKAGVPCARTERFKTLPDFERWLASHRGGRSAWASGTLVLKKSGLAAGKGVFESDDRSELSLFASQVLAGDELLVEEYLSGYELSVFALTDGTDYAILPPCADHKKALAGNLGPNTGGMGAICPVPSADKALMAMVDKHIVAPTFKMMAKEGLGYRGVLFFGIMVTQSGPKLLEYNVRWGDPETQSLFPLLATDPLDMLEAAAAGSVAGMEARLRDQAAVGVTVASEGYPGAHAKGIPVDELPPSDHNALVFHAGTARSKGRKLVTGGGRCFTVVGLGADYFEAHTHAMEAARKVRFEGAWFRPDIGKAFFLD
ncbi:MAG: phosphoribosylamine--glycine ligase [Spirochaetia bacterium]|nr:phosphoribosylamine--glycine ligase [Spirochaetia bacterium]